MNKYILRRGLLSLPIYIEAESFEEAVKQVYGDCTFKEVSYFWDVEVMRISTNSFPPQYDERKRFWIETA